MSTLAMFAISCEKPEPEPEPPTPPVEEPTITTAERLVGKWVLDGYYAKSRDTLLFTDNGNMFYIHGSSDTTTFNYECTEQFLIFYNNNTERYSPQPHYIRFYDDYTYFIIYNYPFLVIDVILNAGFKKVE